MGSAESSQAHASAETALELKRRVAERFGHFVATYCELGEGLYVAYDILDAAITRYFDRVGMLEDYEEALRLGLQADVPFEVVTSGRPTSVSLAGGATYRKVAVRGLNLVRMP
jgi:hypothetical protein